MVASMNIAVQQVSEGGRRRSARLHTAISDVAGTVCMLELFQSVRHLHSVQERVGMLQCPMPGGDIPQHLWRADFKCLGRVSSIHHAINLYEGRVGIVART